MSHSLRTPTLTELWKSYERIRPFVTRTPVLTSSSINHIVSARVSSQTPPNLFFKCENFQKVGAFKFRGACNAMMSLSQEELRNGLATHSSGDFCFVSFSISDFSSFLGNHAAAIALAAKMRGVPAYIVMPNNAPQLKKDAVKGYGAEIIFCEPTLQARETTLENVVKETGAHFVHAYDDYRVIQGQSTACIELLQHGWQEGFVFDTILAPVGGGGLLSGTALASKYLSPQTKVIACEPLNASDAYQSFKSGKFIPSTNPRTICDGLLTSLGQRNFAIINEFVDDIVTVEEDTIIEAMRMIWDRMKIIIEPSCAVTLGAILEGKVDVQGKRIGLIISGGNVDLDHLPWKK
jgi:threonine dehydratase